MRRKTMLVLLALLSMLLTTMGGAVLAQDAGGAQAETGADAGEGGETLPGIGTLVLLVGLVAVLVVGGLMVMRENFNLPTVQQDPRHKPRAKAGGE